MLDFIKINMLKLSNRTVECYLLEVIQLSRNNKNSDSNNLCHAQWDHLVLDVSLIDMLANISYSGMHNGRLGFKRKEITGTTLKDLIYVN